jgi:hypothetical protein
MLWLPLVLVEVLDVYVTHANWQKLSLVFCQKHYERFSNTNWTSVQLYPAPK